MLESLLGGAISAGAGLIGGKMEADATAKNNRLQMIQAVENRELQKQFAKEGIQWRVADARAAGIHPLAALGAQTASFSPIQLGTSPESGMGNALASAGQDIGRAISATSTTAGRANQQVQALQLENMSLQNDLLRSQIAKNVSQVGPPMPALHQKQLIPGQGQTNSASTGLVDIKPAEVTTSVPGAPNVQAGINPEVAFFDAGEGRYSINPGANIKNAIDDDLLGTLSWNIRNRLLPTLGMNYAMPPAKLEEGNMWIFDPITQTYSQKPARAGYIRPLYRTGGGFGGGQQGYRSGGGF